MGMTARTQAGVLVVCAGLLWIAGAQCTLLFSGHLTAHHGHDLMSAAQFDAHVMQPVHAHSEAVTHQMHSDLPAIMARPRAEAPQWLVVIAAAVIVLATGIAAIAQPAARGPPARSALAGGRTTLLNFCINRC